MMRPASRAARPSRRTTRHDEWRKEMPAGHAVPGPALAGGHRLLALSGPLAAAYAACLEPAWPGCPRRAGLGFRDGPGPAQRAIPAPTAAALPQRAPSGHSRTPALPARCHAAGPCLYTTIVPLSTARRLLL